MDINGFRVIATVVAFVLFMGIVVWAYRPAGRRQFEQAARLPLGEGD
jgi:cytochrome c oxidase cbb3-type subunit 4